MDDMPCTEHETPIHDYLDNELAPAERARFEERLASCPNCQQEVASARSLFAALEGLQPVQEPAGFKEGVMAGLPRRPPLHLGRWILAGQMVVTVALLVLAYPLLASWYQRIGRWLAPGWLCHLLADAAARGRDAWASLLSTYTVSIDLTWPKGLGLTWPQAALLTLVLVGLWWLGNRLLLVTEANRNGGTT
jgi:predicted anti-sigma-YlaC factor YlaD